MRAGVAAAVGMGVGAGVAYWWDPVGGRRRRARLGQQLGHGTRQALEGVERGARDLGHRAGGLAARTRSWLERRPLSDEIIIERVRARLGRVSSHPGAIEVTCREGRIDLKGPILEPELHRVLSAVLRVRGVKEVESHLQAHAEPGSVPALQGGTPRRPGPAFDLLQVHWTPATRLLTGSAGAALLAYALKGRGGISSVPGMTGAGFLIRSIANRPWNEIVGIGQRRPAVEVRKSIHVAAPVDEVFAFWRDLEKFPRFMSHVREVRRIDGDRYHWKVSGPADTQFEWDAEITRQVPGELLAWRSVGSSSVKSTGFVRFKPAAEGTEVEIRLSYYPPAGAVGHAVAKLLGADPKKQMDDDLLRLKSLIEDGKATGRGEPVTRQELASSAPAEESLQEKERSEARKRGPRRGEPASGKRQ